jgi:hypothetical protein
VFLSIVGSFSTLFVYPISNNISSLKISLKFELLFVFNNNNNNNKFHIEKKSRSGIGFYFLPTLLILF